MNGPETTAGSSRSKRRASGRTAATVAAQNTMQAAVIATTVPTKELHPVHAGLSEGAIDRRHRTEPHLEDSSGDQGSASLPFAGCRRYLFVGYMLGECAQRANGHQAIGWEGTTEV